jgi:hypothetical protein
VLQWSLWETDRNRQLVIFVRHSRSCQKRNATRTSPKPRGCVGGLKVAAALYRERFLDLTKWPHVQAWINCCWERPAAKRARAMRE